MEQIEEYLKSIDKKLDTLAGIQTLSLFFQLVFIAIIIFNILTFLSIIKF